jgi:hypothetical protein
MISTKEESTSSFLCECGTTTPTLIFYSFLTIFYAYLRVAKISIVALTTFGFKGRQNESKLKMSSFYFNKLDKILTLAVKFIS